MPKHMIARDTHIIPFPIIVLVLIILLKVLVTLLEHKLPPHYFADEFQSVKSDVLVLEDLIKHFLPQLSSHMQFLRLVVVDGASARSIFA